MLQKGFTLIELMIVVAIIGILSMFALPAYQDYTKRTYVSEGMALSTGAKLASTEYFSTMGSWPSNNTAAGIASKITGQAVKDIQISKNGSPTASNAAKGGKITITYNSKVASSATLTLVSSGKSGGSVVWNCASTQTSNETTTKMQTKWLPNNCRNKDANGA